MMRRVLTSLTAAILSSTVVLAAELPAWEKSLEAAETALSKGESHLVDTSIEKALQEGGSDDTIHATIENQIGVIRMSQKRFVDAQKAFSKALELREKTVGPSDPVTFQTISNLALSEHKLGNEQKAEELYKRAIEGKRRIDPTSPSLAKSLTNLANLYGQERRCHEAKTLYLEALGIDSTAFSGTHVEVAQDLFNLGALLHHCNSPAEALTYLERAKRTYESLKDHYGTTKCLHYMALCHTQLNQHDKAAAASLAALNLHQGLKGKGHHDTIVHLLNAADSLDANGDKVGALKLYMEALDSAEHAAEPSNFKLTECNLELGEYYVRHNDKEKAEHFFKKAMAHYHQLNKKDRRALYELPMAYSAFLRNEKRLEESDELSNRYLHVFLPTKASNHPVTKDAAER